MAGGEDCRLKGNGCRSRRHAAHKDCDYGYCQPDCIHDAEEAEREGRARPQCKAQGHRYLAPSASPAGDDQPHGDPTSRGLAQPLAGNWATPADAWGAKLQELNAHREREARLKLETESAHRGVRSTVQFTVWDKVCCLV